jgi:hypothetical protein
VQIPEKRRTGFGATRDSGTPQKGSLRDLAGVETMWRSGSFAILALVLLGLEVGLHPDILENRVELEALSAKDLVNGEPITLGKYYLQTLRVSFGRFADESYMRRLGSRVNGLAIAAFPPSGNASVGVGSAAVASLAALAPTDAAELANLIQNAPTLAPGQVQILTLRKPHASGAFLGIDVILVLRAERGDGREAKEALAAGLREIVQAAETRSLTGLLLPALTVAPDEQGSPSFDDFFRALFESLQASRSPHLIDISFFDGWENKSIQSATAAFNAAWQAKIQERRNILANLYHFQARLLLVGMAICFIASGRHIRLDLRSAIIVASGYTLMLLGAFKSVETILEIFGVSGTGDGTKNLALIVIAFFLAIGFPYVVRWSVKELFNDGKSHG